MPRRTPDPAWIASAAVTVLSSAVVAAVSLSLTPAAVAGPGPQPLVVAAYESPATLVTLTFPAPASTEVAVAPPVAAPQPPSRPARTRPAPAQAADPSCSGAGWQARRGQAAISRLRRAADARAVPVAFRPARSDILGLAHLNTRRVELFVRSCGRQSDALLLHVLAHELGHVVDATSMNDASRAQWMALRGIPAGTPWFGCDGCTDFATPAGDFAEVYAQWQRGASSNRSQLAGTPSRAQLPQLAQQFFRPL